MTGVYFSNFFVKVPLPEVICAGCFLLGNLSKLSVFWKVVFFNYRNFKYGRSIVMISVNLLEGFLINQIRRFGAATSELYFTFENVSRSWCNGSRGDEM